LQLAEPDQVRKNYLRQQLQVLSPSCKQPLLATLMLIIVAIVTAVLSLSLSLVVHQYHLTRAEEVKEWLEPRRVTNVNYQNADSLVQQGRKLEDSSLIDQAIGKYKSALLSFQKALNGMRA
jgi:uncharacterized protein YacL